MQLLNYRIYEAKYPALPPHIQYVLDTNTDYRVIQHTQDGNHK